MKRIFTSLLVILVALIAIPMNAAEITYDFVAAREALDADVTITSSGTSAGKNGMGTDLVYPNELSDLFKGNFAFFFRNECTVKLTSEGLVMNGSKDTYISVLNLKEGDKVTVDYTGSILFCDKPVANIEGITDQWTQCTSGTTYTLTADGNFNIQWKKSKTVISKITVETTATETVSAPGIAVTGVSGINRTVTITPGLGSMGSAVSTYYTINGDDPNNTSEAYAAPFTLSETATVKAVSMLADGTSSPITSLEVTAGESIKLIANATLTDITEVGSSYAFSVTNTNLIGTPSISFSYTYGDIAGEGATYTAAGAGKLCVIASAEGYESSDALETTVYEYEVGESLSLKDANVLAEDDAAWTYNSEGTRYANWSGYNGVSKADYPYWTPAANGQGAIGNFIFEPGENVLMRTIGFIHNSGTQNLSIVGLPENTTAKFVVSTYLSNPFNVFVDATEGTATYGIGAGNTGYAVEAVQLYTKKVPPFDPATAIVNADFSSMEGWTENVSGGFRDFGNGLIGTYRVRTDDFIPAATVDETHLATEYCIGLEARWEGNFASYNQDVMLPAGNYKLTFDVENVNAGTNSANYNNLFKVTNGETVYVDESTEWMNGKSGWTSHAIRFILTEDATVNISLGFGTGSNNFGHANTPALYVSHLALGTFDPLVDFKEIALKEVDALPTGDALFLYPVDAVNTAKAAIETAATVDDINAAVATAKAAQNKPAADKAYKITNTTATGNLCIAEGKISVAQGATVKFTAVEGGYVLSKDSLYVFKTTDNNWTLSTTKNIAEAYVLTFNPVEGGYTIKGAKGLFGLDSTDEGSTVYANKAAANNGIWTIAEYDESAENALATALAALNAEIAVADSLLAIEANTEGREAFQTAINDARALLTSTDIEVINTGVNTLKAAEATFKAANFKAPIADGKYYIYNNGTKNYLAAGADWGTHAVVNATGLDYTLTQADGKYTIDSQVSNGGESHFLNGEWNDGAAMGWTFAAVEGKEGVYTISNGEKFLTAAENNLVTLADDATAEAAQWSLKTLEARIAELATATAEAPVNATFLIQDANFGRNDLRKSAWTIEAANKNLSGGNNTNNCAESFHSTFTLSQVLAGAPKGVYAMTAQGFYRQDGAVNDTVPYFFANDEKMTFPVKTGTENSMSDASASFSAGNYTIDPIFVEVTEAGQLTIGAKCDTTTVWAIWDNFVLSYYGAEATIDQAKNAAIIKELAELRAKATELKEQVEVAVVKTAVEDALTATANVEGAEAINAAIATMKEAVDKADASVSAKAKLANMKQLVDATNVYTAEALNEYYTQWEVKYQDGTITKAEAAALQDPFVVTGWHAALTCDNFLLSAWDTNPDFQNARYYINSWSTEGNNDGSEFKVPFFEYWTGDDNSLAKDTLTATMKNLKPGYYEVSAWVRVRAKNGYTAPAYGIALQANDGEAVNVADGAQIGESQFYLKEVTAAGFVAEDSVLKIKFNVAEDNNISWLSFKNVKFEKKPAPVVPIDGINYSWESPEGDPMQWGGTIAYVNGDGERLNYLNSGYYTICLNGKKANLPDTVASANAGKMVITLDKPLHAGDTIAYTAYLNKNTSKEASAYILFENGTAVEGEVFGDEANIDAAFNGVPTLKYTIVPAEAAGSKTITLTRSKTGTNLFITKLQVIATQLELTLDVERYPGMGYGAQEATVDFARAKAYLGVEEITTDMLRIVNPNDSLISDYAPFDGWFNGEGAAETWNSLNEPDPKKAGICVKFFEAIPEGKFSICDMNGADSIGAVYTTKWALVANEKQVTYTINVKFVEKPVIALTLADLNKVDEQTVALTSELGKCYEGLTADVDVAAILAKLEVASLNDVTIYAVQSDGSLDDNYKLGTTDGWRNAAGDWQTWGNDAYFFVKTDFALESGQIYAAGGMDGKNTTEDWENPATYTATYAFVKAGSADAVVLKVTLTYTVPTGINAIARDAQNADIYNINGQKVNKAQKGLYIINGKKTVVK